MRTFATLAIAVLTAGCAMPQGMAVPQDVVNMAQTVRPGGTFVLEITGDGTILGVEAEIDVSAVPAVCRQSADRKVPGGEAVAAEKEMASGALYYEIVKMVDGRRIEILMKPDGTVAGMEKPLQPGEYPEAIVEAARRAVPAGDLEAVESVSGPEAATGEDYHVKIRTGDEVQRISVRKDGTVIRVVRKMAAEVRVPRR